MLRGFISTLGLWILTDNKKLYARINEIRDEEEISDRSLNYSSDKIDPYLLYEPRQHELPVPDFSSILAPIKDICEPEQMNGFSYKLNSQPSKDFQISGGWNSINGPNNFYTLSASIFSRSKKTGHTNYVSGTFHSYGQMNFNGSYDIIKDLNSKINLNFPTKEVKQSNILVELRKKLQNKSISLKCDGGLIGLSSLILTYMHSLNPDFYFGGESGYITQKNRKYLKFGGSLSDDYHNFGIVISNNSSSSDGVTADLGYKYRYNSKLAFASNWRIHFLHKIYESVLGVRIRFFSENEFICTLSSNGSSSTSLQHIINDFAAIKFCAETNLRYYPEKYNFGITLNMDVLK